MTFFNRAACFTDIHFGNKNNSRQHNDDCAEFVDWFIEQSRDCETCIFLGDWHHHRAGVNVSTLNYSVENVKKLSENFERVYMIMGNHDLYYREKRDLNSLPYAGLFNNVTLVEDTLVQDDVALVPWLVGNEWKQVNKIKARYMFGHFELPSFYMNAMVQMPDVGEINRDHFAGVGHMYSGHFHKRQSHKNITYVGNCFPHNYADAGDDDRGMTIIEWGKPAVHHSWPDQPRYRVYNLSDVLKTPEDLLKPAMHCRVNLDIDITYEEATFIKETFVGTYGLRELTLIPVKETTIGDDIQLGNVAFESIDTIVTNQLTSIQSDTYDPNLLLDIYRNL